MVKDEDGLPVEIWKDVPSIPEIEASSHGRIRSRRHTGIMPHGGSRDYEGTPRFGSITSSSMDARHLYFGARYGRGVGNVKVHFAVCEAFNGTAPVGINRVRHLNENGLDNRPENLVWGSQKRNMNDPVFKDYLYRRVNPKDKQKMTKREKRKGIYDSIYDIGLQLRERKQAANNNHLNFKADLFEYAAYDTN